MMFQIITMEEKVTESEICSFFKNKTIFITGASGFMGKVLLEKLLYCCSDLDKIYIVMRSKKGRNIETRLDEMFKLPVRNHAKIMLSSCLVKIIQDDVIS